MECSLHKPTDTHQRNKKNQETIKSNLLGEKENDLSATSFNQS